MDVRRALDIFNDKYNYAVKLDGKPVWIEQVDEFNGMATVQLGSRPDNTHTVSVDRLIEDEHQ
ncbi:spore protein [Paenibacillus macquariensis subsp. defensor]|uniref:Small acid-soluble spore protein H (Minor) n=1 Tax=Paenibacillus macquariensis TaxID=948756 RepID=A0ABY1JQX6_9BACL|nr:H-type small acid-soluble spore protein [Paenibacillus macquariensis]MEC0092655.1 H-type small acid-soluble spore protein [Paenibacillus macquariensis]OAB36593.1 spore protein [Paenibacillus macquariensis subsp. macquariensis]OAB39381.1 spore protein [Paenibacillus macquariensis subsp. defensor]SIQ63138.1 small acid-soluble spore protein H (minor) [Paenibacillus macquariensis]